MRLWAYQEGASARLDPLETRSHNEANGLADLVERAWLATALRGGSSLLDAAGGWEGQADVSLFGLRSSSTALLGFPPPEKTRRDPMTMQNFTANGHPPKHGFGHPKAEAWHPHSIKP